MEPGGGGGDGGTEARKEAMEDPVDSGNVEAVISLLQSQSLSRGEPPNGGDPRLASSRDLAAVEAGELPLRAVDLQSSPPPQTKVEDSDEEGEVAKGKDSEAAATEEEEDWEALANEDTLPGESLLDSKQAAPSRAADSGVSVTKRRGRGAFLYQKDFLYSDSSDSPTTSSFVDNREDEEDERDGIVLREARFGVRHVLVLRGLSVSTRTEDLEKLFESFRDQGVAIRWVDDTTALAVFRTPSIANEALTRAQYPFKVHVLDEGDILVSKLSQTDLEPPCPRPKTSVKTAQRLIAHGMGIKPSVVFGSNELRKQEEEARRNRIRARQNMRDDAWGPD